MKSRQILGFIFGLVLFQGQIMAQFAPAAGQPGSTAIFKDSSCFVGWATNCIIRRAYQNIADTSLGYATTGDSSMAVGPAGQNGVVSLGDGGSAILTFERPLFNGEGWDFAVFENSFADYFLELAFVDVSSDGINYFRFPSVSLTDTLVQIGNFDSLDARKINNLAGKYRMFYGTPFDLEELKNEAGLDVNHITHIKITDVVGSIDNRFDQRDSHGNKINDPWPTPFPSSGFDLDAVGAIHQLPAGISEISDENFMQVFPNPASQILNLKLKHSLASEAEFRIYSFTGKLVGSAHCNSNLVNIDVSGLEPGIYFIRLISGETSLSKKLEIIR